MFGNGVSGGGGGGGQASAGLGWTVSGSWDYSGQPVDHITFLDLDMDECLIMVEGINTDAVDQVQMVLSDDNGASFYTFGKYRAYNSAGTLVSMDAIPFLGSNQTSRYGLYHGLNLRSVNVARHFLSPWVATATHVLPTSSSVNPINAIKFKTLSGSLINAGSIKILTR